MLKRPGTGCRSKGKVDSLELIAHSKNGFLPFGYQLYQVQQAEASFPLIQVWMI